jgi:hypothetical protein
MKPSHYAIARCLKDLPGMSNEMLGDIIGKLNADGYIAESEMHAVGSKESEGAMQQVSETGFVKLQTPIEAAADPRKAALLRSVVAQCRVLGVHFDPEKPISMTELDRQLAGKDITARLKLKQSMSMIGLIA